MKRKNLATMLCLGLMPMAGTTSAEAGQKKRVVLVHGIFQQGDCFNPLKKKLEQQGCECLIPALKPADANTGLEPLAAQLRKEIDQKWGRDASIHIVAHSMGGLVSRYYLQELGGYARCGSLVTLATPHHGTCMAYFYPGKGASQMRPNSEFLQQLDQTSHRLKDVRLISYRTPFDLMILPSTSSCWDCAQNEMVWAPAHPLVMHTPRVQRHIFEVIHSESSTAGQSK